MSADTTISVACLCSAASYKFQVPSSSLPLKAFFCHCDTCRHGSGTLCESWVRLHSPAPGDLSALTAYKFSKDVTRYFCSTCGAQIFFHDKRDNTWDIATGLLDKSNGVVEFAGHIWASSVANDGGFISWLPSLNGKRLQRWTKDSDVSGELDVETLKSAKTGNDVTPQSVPAECVCRGVSFSISKPNEKSTQCTSPFPNLIIQSQTGAAENPHNEPWWLRGTRYYAGTCACKSCRLASGFDIVEWAFVPAANISLPDGQAFKLVFGSMKSYNSSKGVTRTFCKVCGAMVFFSIDTRPDIIDVAVGLLNARSGPRAEELLDWETKRVSFEEEALNKTLVQGLTEGLRAWGEQRRMAAAASQE